MKLFVFFFFILFQSHFFGQIPNIDWAKCFGGSNDEWGNSIVESSDGGYVVAGWTQSNDGDVSGLHGTIINSDVLIVKFNSQGTIKWEKLLGGSNDDQANCIQNTNDGGYIVLGWSNSSDGDISTPTQNSDFWLIKLDSIGNIEWDRSFGGTDTDQGYSVNQSSDGGYILVGNTGSDDGDVSGYHTGINRVPDIWVVKTDSLGIIEWQKCLGGSLIEYGFDIKETNNGDFIVIGATESFDGDVSSNHGPLDAWVVKLDSLGTIIFQKCYGGSDDEYASSLEITNDGGFIFAGRTYSNDGDVSGNHLLNSTYYSADFWMVKVDSLGEIEWQKCLGGNLEDFAYSIKPTIDNTYIVAGMARSPNNGDVNGFHGNSDFWIIKLDSTGNETWKKCMGGTGYDNAFSIVQTSEGNFVITGNTASNDGDVSSNKGSADVWVVKLQSDLVSTIQLSKNSFSISPNPTSEEISIKNINSGSCIEIIDLLGKIVYSNIIFDDNETISINNLNQGLYIVSVNFEGNPVTKKLEILK